MKLIITYLVSLVVLLSLDLLWLGFIAKSFYQKYLGNILAENVNWTAAVLFYLVYTFGIIVFCVMPNTASLVKTALFGALFGFIAYATYDLTNLATLKGFPLNVAVVDIIWGAVITCLISVSAYYVINNLN
jgi:uncharacterized membrane protein